MCTVRCIVGSDYDYRAQYPMSSSYIDAGIHSNASLVVRQYCIIFRGHRMKYIVMLSHPVKYDGPERKSSEKTAIRLYSILSGNIYSRIWSCVLIALKNNFFT